MLNSTNNAVVYGVEALTVGYGHFILSVGHLANSSKYDHVKMGLFLFVTTAFLTSHSVPRHVRLLAPLTAHSAHSLRSALLC